MGRFSRKFKRNPAQGFTGKKATIKGIRKMMMKAQIEYWKQLNAGLINEDGTPVNAEDIEVDVEVDLDDTDEQE
jgi:hypothetical protein